MLKRGTRMNNESKKMDTDFIACHCHRALLLHRFSSVSISVPYLIHRWIDNEAG